MKITGLLSPERDILAGETAVVNHEQGMVSVIITVVLRVFIGP
ncbi:MAG: hypothetical protein P8Q31_04170 [Luminiphilus sp.]|jgi:hypothetical protein|nr:hypothetical protein [Luminiphilus sp.]MDG1460697.1 hypothetical protein [Luminiphilus sp.]